MDLSKKKHSQNRPRIGLHYDHFRFDRLPRGSQSQTPALLFHYIDGGSYGEHTLRRNTDDLADIALRQRVLSDMSELSLETELFGEKWRCRSPFLLWV